MSLARRLTRPAHRRRQRRGPRATGSAHDEVQPGHTALVTLPAELDLLTTPQAGDRLRAALTSSDSVVVGDLTGTFYCDVAAARMLLWIHHDAAIDGAQLRLAVLAGPVLRVLELLALDGQLDLYPSVREAAGGTASRQAGRLNQLGEGAVP
jgi:anti-anti-sigma regulatory factor